MNDTWYYHWELPAFNENAKYQPRIPFENRWKAFLSFPVQYKCITDFSSVEILRWDGISSMDAFGVTFSVTGRFNPSWFPSRQRARHGSARRALSVTIPWLTGLPELACQKLSKIIPAGSLASVKSKHVGYGANYNAGLKARKWEIKYLILLLARIWGEDIVEDRELQTLTWYDEHFFI